MVRVHYPELSRCHVVTLSRCHTVTLSHCVYNDNSASAPPIHNTIDHCYDTQYPNNYLKLGYTRLTLIMWLGDFNKTT